METFILTVLKIVVVALALFFTRVAVQSVHEGQMRNHWGSWALMLVGSFMGFAFICEVASLEPMQWLPHLGAVMLGQSLAYFWWATPLPKPVSE